MPRHPPCALEYLIIFLITFSQGNVELLSFRFLIQIAFSAVLFETVVFLPRFSIRKKPSFQRSIRFPPEASRLSFRSAFNIGDSWKNFMRSKPSDQPSADPSFAADRFRSAVASFRPAFSLRR